MKGIAGIYLSTLLFGLIFCTMVSLADLNSPRGEVWSLRLAGISEFEFRYGFDQVGEDNKVYLITEQNEESIATCFDMCRDCLSAWMPGLAFISQQDGLMIGTMFIFFEFNAAIEFITFPVVLLMMFGYDLELIGEFNEIVDQVVCDSNIYISSDIFQSPFLRSLPKDQL